MDTYCVKGFEYVADAESGINRRNLVTLASGLTWKKAKEERAYYANVRYFKGVKPRIVKERGRLRIVTALSPEGRRPWTDEIVWY